MIRTSFDREWFVAKDGDAAASRVGPVTLPYDAMLFEERDADTKNGGHTGYFPGGAYRYSKTFTAAQSWAGRVVMLEFEGVYHRCQVLVNGKLAGGRASGYSVFHVQIDDLLSYGGENTIEVLADTTDGPNGRWYTGSGIYRPVHLMVAPSVHVAPLGVRVATNEISGGSARLRVEADIVNEGDAMQQVELQVDICDPQGDVVATTVAEVSVAAGESVTSAQWVDVADAMLWSPQTPHLHTARVTATAGPAVDVAVEQFGIRTITVDARNGLRINGQSVKLRGSCIHHDHGVIGAHTLPAAEERKVAILKASGFNAIRSAHNPASRALLRACDRQGMLVMDELTDAWLRPKVSNDYSLDFETWWERDLESLVARDFNHPSVIMYSIGNEIAETSTPHGVVLNKKIADRTRELDPTRLVTNGINGFLNLISPQDEEKLAEKARKARESGENPNKNLIGILNLIMGVLDKNLERLVRLPAVDKRTQGAFADLDVAGYNYMVGRYEIDGKLHPERVIVGSETRSAHTARIWKKIEHLTYVIGDFAWTGWDYIGEAGLATKEYGTTKRQIYHPYPALLAGEPVIDITGRRQTQSYLNEIAWHLATGPHLAVEPVQHSGEKSVKTGWRATNSIASWSWEGCEGRLATVEVYADAAAVELQLNGQRVERAAAGRDGDYLTRFTLPYQPGELTAISYSMAGKEIGRTTLTSAGDSLKLTAAPERATLVADGYDLAYIPIALTDADGIDRPLADREVTVTVEGQAVLLGLGSGEAITREGFTSHTHRTFNGHALAVLRAGHVAGDVHVSITAEGLAPVHVQIPVLAPEPPVDPTGLSHTIA